MVVSNSVSRIFLSVKPSIFQSHTRSMPQVQLILLWASFNFKRKNEFVVSYVLQSESYAFLERGRKLCHVMGWLFLQRFDLNGWRDAKEAGAVFSVSFKWFAWFTIAFLDPPDDMTCTDLEFLYPDWDFLCRLYSWLQVHRQCAKNHVVEEYVFVFPVKRIYWSGLNRYFPWA